MTTTTTPNSSSDTLIGTTKADNLDGGAGNDYLNGGAGNDILDGGSGFDRLEGGSGADTLIYTASENQWILNNVRYIGTEDGLSSTTDSTNLNFSGYDRYDGGNGANASVQTFLGGDGIDTLQLRLTGAQYAAYSGAIDDFIYNTIAPNTNPTTKQAIYSEYLFKVFNLKVSGIEKVDVVVDGVKINLTASDAPTLDLNPATVGNQASGTASGNEDTAIALSISSALTDSSEAHSIRIEGVPTGAVLKSGATVLTANNGSYTLTPAQLSGLTITPPDNFHGNFQLKITASSKDGAAAAATTTGNLTVNVANVEDEATGTLGVTGTAEEGGSLTASLTNVVDDDTTTGTTSVGYQWQVLNGSTWTDIGGATNAQLSIPGDQSYVGKEVRVVATTTDQLNGTTDFVSAAQTIANVEDEATGTLGVTGTAEEGGSLTASLTNVVDDDTTTGTTSVGYQWQVLNGSTWTDIGGATNAQLSIPGDQSYVGKEVRVVATTTDQLNGTTDFVSAAQTIANVEDEATGTLGVTGTAEEGGSLTASLTNVVDDDTTTGTTSVGYQWQVLNGSTWTDIGGATNAQLSIPGDQSYVGKEVRVVATTTDQLNGTTDFVSAAQTIANVEDEATGTLGVTGTAEEGGSLTASLTNVVDDDTTTGTTSVGYQWQVLNGSTWTDIGGATNAQLSIPGDQSYVGKEVRVVATTTDQLNGTTDFVSAAQTIANVEDEATGTLGVTGTAEEGGSLTASLTNVVDDDTTTGTTSVGYQWQVLNGSTWTDIGGATNAQLSIPGDQSYVGKEVRVVATTTDQLNGTTDFVSAAQTIANVEDEATGTLGVTGTAEEGGSLTASLTNVVDDDTTTGTTSVGYQWQVLNGSTWTDIGGATNAQLSIPGDQSYVGKEVRVVATTTDQLNGTTDFVSAAQTIANVEDEATGTLGVTGTAEEGGSLTASLTNVVDDDTTTGTTSVGYQWQVLNGSTWTDIGGATNAQLSIPGDQSYVGKEVRVVATTTDQLNGTTDFVSAAQTIANVEDEATGTLGVTGTAEEGGSLTASLTNVVDDDTTTGTTSVGYQWQVLNGSTWTDIGGATNAQLSIPGDQSYVGKEVRVVATTTDQLNGTTDFVSAAQTIANVEDEATGTLGVTGTAEEGGSLTASLTNVVDDDTTTGTTSVGYQWQVLNGSTWTDIGGATNAQLSIPGDQSYVGKEVRVVATTTDQLNGTTDFVSAAQTIANVEDEATGTLGVTGTAEEGGSLTASLTNVVDDDTTTGTTSVGYQWQVLNGSTWTDIGGATNAQLSIPGDQSYVGKEVRVVATTTDQLNGTTDFVSAAQTIANVEDEATGTLGVTGTAEEGGSLTASLTNVVDDDTTTGTTSVGYQWQVLNGSTWTDIGGATNAQLSIPGDQSYVGKEVRVVATTTDQLNGTTDFVSAAQTIANVEDEATGTLGVTGTAEEGGSLTASLTNVVDDDTTTGTTSVGYQWQVLNGSTWTDIGGATNAQLSIPGDQSYVGKEVRVVATTTDQLNGTTDFVSAAQTIANVEDEATGTLGVTGTAEEGGSLTASLTNVVDDDTTTGTTSVGYQWQVLNGSTWTDIGGATNAQLSIPGDQSYVGKEVRVVATTTDQLNGTTDFVSAAQTIANVEDEATGTLGVTGTAEEGGSLTASLTNVVDDDTTTGTTSVGYQWQVLNGSTWTDIGGATNAQLSIPGDQSYVGKEVRVVATTTDQLNGTTDFVSAAQTIANVEDEATGTLGVTGTAEEGGSLTASLTNVVDDDTTTGTTSVGYQWQVLNGSTWTDIGGATNAQLSIPGDQSYVGKEVRVVATTTDQLNGTTDFVSAAQTIANVEDEATGTLGVTGTAEEGGSLTASLTNVVDDDTTTGTTSVGYQWQVLNGSTWTDIGGATNAQLSIPGDQSYVGKEVRVVATTTDQLNGTTDFVSAAQTIANVEDAPTISVDGISSYTIGGAAAVIDSTITVSDVDSVQLQGAQVSITGNRQSGDALGFINQSGISGSYNGATGVLTLSGNATLAAYEAAIESITFSSSSSSTASRTISFVVTDLQGTASAADTAVVNVSAPLNQTPTANGDNVISNASINSAIVIPEWALLFNDTDPENGTLDVNGVGGAADGTVSHAAGTGSAGSVTFTVGVDALPLGGRGFTYTATDGTSTSGAATVAVTLDTSAALDGTNGNDVLIGTGPVTFVGGTGNDILVANGSSDNIYQFGLNDGANLVSDAGGTDRVAMTTVSGTADLGVLNFERVGNDLIIEVGGTDITIRNHYVSSNTIEGIQFINGGMIYGYTLGTNVYLMGIDTLSPLDGAGSRDVIASSSGSETLNGLNGDDLLFGNDGVDTINGGASNDLIVGGAGNDNLNGDNGNDVLVGGLGQDTLNGGADPDRFVFTDVADSPFATPDTIAGFSTSNDDIIDLSRIDANVNVAGNQTFLFAGQSTTTSAHSVNWYQSGGNTYVQADVTGDATADFMIMLSGLHTLTGSGGGADFIL